MPTFCRRIERRVSKNVRTEDCRGHTSIADGTETAYIEMVVDVDALLRSLGEQAMRNASGRAVLGSGMIVAKATKRTHTPPTSAPAASRILAALNDGLKDL